MAFPRLCAGAAALFLLLGVTGCESPSAAFDSAAGQRGFQRAEIEGQGFHHAVFRKRGAPGPLHVYLAGDGRPWQRPLLPAGDPTPRDPLVLDLMALDPAEAVLLGRPCYHGLQDTAPCTAALWTGRRFAAEVVASLAQALRRIDGARGRPLVLIGHSGGGVLAMLLAARLPETQAVVTLAAPLDIAAWADHHRDPPLAGSLNPARAAALPASVRQLHFAGGRDRVVPPALLSEALARLGGPAPLVVAEAGHVDGWTRLWSAVLACLERTAGSEAVTETEEHDVLLAPGVTEVAAVAGGDRGPLIECRRQ